MTRAYADPSRWPGVDELDLDSRHDGHRAVVADRLQPVERAGGVELGVERQRRSVLRVAVLVGLPRVFFLDVRGVGQHERAQIARARRAEHAPAKALGDEPRQVAAVIEVRVREDDRVDPRRDRWEAPPSCAAAAPSAPGRGRSRSRIRRSPRLEQVLRAGDGAGGSEKRQGGGHGRALYSEGYAMAA